MKILITGGAGFIGSHLVDKLLALGHHIYVVDDLSSGIMKNIRQNQKDPKFHFYADTILNQSLMEELIAKCDHVYHMAAAVGVKLIMNRPVETLETNVKGTEMVLAIANKYKKKVLIASTSEVYGKIMEDNGGHALHEGADRLMGATTKRRWAYACSKAFDEFLALAYFEEKKLPVVIARLFNTVGPRQSGQYGMVLPSFVQKALIGKPIIIYGDGRQSRSFIHVCDVAEALIKLMNEDKALGNVYNIGSQKEITIEELAYKVKEMTGSSSPIEYLSYDRAYGAGFEDMQRRLPDITKINKLLNFKPEKDLNAIINSVIKYYM
jgi:UDP-glucose 4-epimerase